MFIERADEATASGDLADYLAEERAGWGFVPNYASCFAARPEVARAWRTLNVTIRSGMDRRVYEVVSIAAARARRSTYCTAAHSMFLRDVCGDEATVRAIDADPTGARLAERDADIYRFATKLATEPASVGQGDVDRLRALGLSDVDVADVVYAASARLFFTAVLDGLGAQLDEPTAAAVGSDLLEGMLVGRPPADS